MSNLPNLSSLKRGGAGGALDSNQLALYRGVETWLSNNRHWVPENPDISLSDPLPAMNGIRCKVVNTRKLDRPLMDLFRVHYDSGCGDVVARFDNDVDRHLYEVFIPYPKNFLAPAAGSIRCCGWPTFFDEPKKLITLAGAVTMSAYFTTQPVLWKNLALWAHALWVG